MADWALFTFDRAGNTTVYVEHAQAGAPARRFDERSAKLAADQVNGQSAVSGVRALARPAETLLTRA